MLSFKPILLTLLTAVVCLSASADDVIEDKGSGGINWTKGIVYAYGYGVAPEKSKPAKKRLLARRAAQVDAYRNMGEILSGVRVTSTTLVSDMEAANDTVKTKLDTVVKGASMVSDHFQNDIATVRLEVSLDGSFFNAVKDPKHNERKYGQSSSLLFQLKQSSEQLDFSWLRHLSPFPNAYASESANAPIITSTEDMQFAKLILKRLQDQDPKKVISQLSQEIAVMESNYSFTGLLIDASEVSNFKIATIPKIRKPSGEVIYPKDSLLAGSQLSRRPVSYDFDVNDAIQNDRVAINPLVIKAESTYQLRTSDLIISEKNANAISSNPALLKSIGQAGVMIVVADN